MFSVQDRLEISEEQESFLKWVWAILLGQRKWKDFVTLDTLHASCSGLEPTVKARWLVAFARRCKFPSIRLLIFLRVYSSPSIFNISFSIFFQRWIVVDKRPWWGSPLLLTLSSKGKRRFLLLRLCSLLKLLPRGRVQVKMTVLLRSQRVCLLLHYWERMIQHLSGEWWICPSNYSVQIIHSSIFYCILEFIHLLPHATKLAFHSGWVFFWHSCPPIGLAIRSFLIMVSFDPSAFFFILILHSPLSFLVLGFSDSPQFFILASHFFKLAIKGWTCYVTCSASISCYEVPFCHLGKMAWMIGIPTDSAKLMMRKITKLRTSSHWMDDPMVGRVSSENLQESLWKKCNTSVWCLPKRLRYLSWKGRKLLREKNDLEWILAEHLCAPLDYVILLFYSCFLS